VVLGAGEGAGKMPQPANDLFHILRCLLHLETLTFMWNDQNKGQFLQEFLSLLFQCSPKLGTFSVKITNAFKAELSIIP